MKEILYIQAGNFSNYTGTHFWNTQESYLSNDDPEEPVVNRDRSFRNESEHSTLCPRLLIFDWKENFGTLTRDNALGDEANHEPDENIPKIWTENVVEIRQVPIPKSTYQAHMSDTPEGSQGSFGEETRSEGRPEGLVRYWSDYNRLYYLPRTIQKVPNPPSKTQMNGNWALSQEIFTSYNEEADLMEGSLRLFLEECDSLEGIQVMNDVEQFGGFTGAFLTSFQDDYRKSSSFVFPLLSGTYNGQIDLNDASSTRKIINDALYLRTLQDISSIIIPIQPPFTWPRTAWREASDDDKNSTYHQSALLSAHIESATLPLRLTGTYENMSSLSAKLNWRDTTSFGELSGTFPLSTVSPEFLSTPTQFSLPTSAKKEAECYSRIDVLRGFSAADSKAYEAYSSGLTSVGHISRFQTLAYPLPSSFPPIFKSTPYIARTFQDSTHPIAEPLSTVKGVASISVGSGTAEILFYYANFAETCMRRRALAATSVGIDFDDLKDLVNDLWTIHDNYSGDVEL